MPHSLRGRLYKRLRLYELLPKEIVAVPEVRVLASTIGNALSRPVKLAFYIGTPGPFQKVTALVMSETGQALGYAKLASLPASCDSLEHERTTLRVLSDSPNVARHVPQVLFWQRDQHLALLLTSSGPRRAGPKSLGDPHLSFFENLGRVFGKLMPFGTSNMWVDMVTLFRELEPTLSDDWLGRYQRAFSLLTTELVPRDVLVTLAHRDFAPWNTRLLEDGALYAFDWEFSRADYLADYDHHHFELMTSLLLGSRTGRKPPEAKSGSSRLSHLAYLVDVGLFYHSALSAWQGVKDDRVLKRVGSEMDEALG